MELNVILSTSWSFVESMINFHEDLYGDSLVSDSSSDEDLEDDSDEGDEDNIDEEEK